TDGKGPFLGVDWIDGYRLAAIKRELSKPVRWDVASTLALQMSQEALPWKEIADVVLKAPPKDADVSQALEVLSYWDGHVTVDSPSATVYELFLAEMAVRVARTMAPRAFAWALGQGGSILTDHNFFCFRRIGHLVRLLREQPDGWLRRPWPEE